MTLYEKIKDAIKKGIEPKDIAAIYSVSLSIVNKTKTLMREQELDAMDDEPNAGIGDNE